MAGRRVVTADRRLDAGAAGADSHLLRVAAVARRAASARRAAAQGRTHVVPEPGLGREHVLRAEDAAAAPAAVPGGPRRPGRHGASAWWSTRTRSTRRARPRSTGSPVPRRGRARGLAVGARDRGRHLVRLRRGDRRGRRRALPHVNSMGGSLAWRGGRAGSGTPGASPTRPASSRRCGFTSSAERPTGGSSRASSPTTGSPRTSCPRRPTGAGRWTSSRRVTAASGRSSCAASRATARVADGRRPRRRVHPRGVRRRTLFLSRCAAPRTAGAAPRARRRGDRRRCRRGRAAGRARDRGDRRDRRPAVGGGHRRRPLGIRAFDHDGRPQPAGGAAGQLASTRPRKLGAGAVAWAWRRSSRRARGGCMPTTTSAAPHRAGRRSRRSTSRASR